MLIQRVLSRKRSSTRRDGVPTRRWSTWVAIGLVLTSLGAGAASMMRNRRPSGRVAFVGSTSSRSGYRASTDAAFGSREPGGFTYFSVTIQAPDGAELYRSGRYAAWFTTRLCWDEADRLWIDSADTGVDVIAATPGGWRRHRWMKDSRSDSIIDAETGGRLTVVDWKPPGAIRPAATE